MIYKIVGSYMLVACFVAAFLAVRGVQAPIHLSTYFQGFLVNTNLDMANFGIEIPNIPFIDVEAVVTLDPTGVLILDWFIDFAKGFFNFINFLIEILNFLVLLINVIVEVLQFFIFFIKNLITMRNQITA